MIIKLIKKIFYIFWKYLGLKNIEKLLKIQILEQLYLKEKFSDKKNLVKNGFKVFSQQDEDGIIEEIFKRIGVSTKKFIEIGVETGDECNSTYLLHKGWSGLWVEGNTNFKDSIYKEFNKYLKRNLKTVFCKVNPNNIKTELLNFFQQNEEIDLLSIDIGTHTYHTLESINFINSRVIVTEYNAKYGPSLEWISKYDENSVWDGTDNYGASLKSFEKMLEKKNYKLVACNISGANAFFIRGDLIKDKFEDDFSSEHHFKEGRYWLKTAFEKDYKVKIS